MYVDKRRSFGSSSSSRTHFSVLLLQLLCAHLGAGLLMMEVVAGSIHARPREEVCHSLGTHAGLGLSNASGAERLQQHGRNQLKGQGGVNPWKILLRQVANGLTGVLVIAMVVSFAVTDYAEGGMLVIVILFNTVVWLPARVPRQEDHTAQYGVALRQSHPGGRPRAHCHGRAHAQ
jgi:magnesium-transporting ATPase (P-type)